MDRFHKNSLNLLFISAFIFIFCGSFFCNISLGNEMGAPGAMGYGPSTAAGYWTDSSSGYGSGTSIGLNPGHSSVNYATNPYSMGSLTYGSDTITGNLSGGSVPYSGVYDFRGNLQATSLDGFIQYSTPSDQGYYSQAGAHSTSGVVMFGGSNYTGTSSKIRSSQSTGGSLGYSSLNNPIIPGAMGSTMYGTSSTYSGYLNDQDQGYREVTATEESILAGQGIDVRRYNQDILKSSLESSRDNPVLEPFNLPATVNNAPRRPGTGTEADATSLKMQMISEMDIEEFLRLKAKADEDIRKQTQENWDNKYDDKKAEPEENPTKAGSNTGMTNVGEGASAVPSEPLDVKALETEFMQQFAKQMAAGDKYLSQGKYYKAADAYTLACLYNPETYMGYIRKSIALFGAGEYVNSSLFLSIGIKISKDFPEEKIDVASMFPDEAIYTERLKDVAVKINEFKSGDLYLLYSYIVYQDGQAAEAQRTILQAMSKLEDKSAAEILKSRIDKARN